MATSPFRARIRKSIADPALQIALDNNARRRVQARLTALATLPDARARRQRAHALRAEVIAHLDEYLDEFTARAAANGQIVHRAADAAEAVKIVLQIAQSHNAKSIAKSKSMISEEIGLNQALEAQGLRVVETDLGEYIVQLRGEKPAHIITPAVHLSRQEVGRLFEEKLGVPYTEDVPTLTAAARRLLREVFLSADIGITGVNFGVAETGALCIVTNEGNARMVTTVPPVHIALMGMERLAPTLEDLALLLSLLPRSATGQKLTVYTQLIQSPRRAGELDGARERHLVILDNGRRRMRNSPLQEALYCIRCGACLNACPVFRELGGHAYVGRDGSIAPYSGPIGSVVSPGLLSLEQFGHLAQASSLCGACKDACPVDIDLPRLLTRVRAGRTPQPTQVHGIGLSPFTRLGLGAYGRIAASGSMFAIAQRLSGMAAHLFFPFSDWFRMPAFTRWGLSRDFPRPALKPFRARFQARTAADSGFENQPGGNEAESKEARPQTEKTREFVESLLAVNGEIHHTSDTALTGDLIDFLKERKIQTLAAWEAIPGVEPAQLSGAGFRIVPADDPSSQAGLTGATCGISESGTLVLASGAGQPAGASLLPGVHLAVLHTSQIVSSLEEALQFPEIRRAATTVLVTGPSRTADIEMTLTIGVHGPGELHVFLVDG